MSTFLFIVSACFLGYFLLLDLCYALLFMISFLESGRHMRRVAFGDRRKMITSPFVPPISIIIPAYNEEECIVDSVDALRLLEYSQFEIVVVDDGSTDRTLARLTEAYQLTVSHQPLRMRVPCQPIERVFTSQRIPNLVVLTKQNGNGKSDAVNAGINASRYPLLCVSDADAVLEKDALERVVRPFLERPRETIAAAGIVRIVNGCSIRSGRVTEVRAPRNPLAALQTLEYLRAFLASRTAWSRLGALFLVSGAFGLFRTDAVVEVGGFSTTTLGEDLELILRLHHHFRERRRHYRVVFIPDPVVWTEAPETFAALRNQRDRWHRGLLECLWRYRDMTLRPRYGLLGCVALPYLWLFEVGGPLVETLGYAIVLVSAIVGVLNAPFLLLFVLLAMAFGVALSLSALLMDEVRLGRGQPVRDVAMLACYAVLENLGYRQLLAIWRFAVTVQVLRGKKGSWGAMPRRGFQQD